MDCTVLCCPAPHCKQRKLGALCQSAAPAPARAALLAPSPAQSPVQGQLLPLLLLLLAAGAPPCSRPGAGRPPCTLHVLRLSALVCWRDAKAAWQARTIEQALVQVRDKRMPHAAGAMLLRMQRHLAADAPGTQVVGREQAQRHRRRPQRAQREVDAALRCPGVNTSAGPCSREQAGVCAPAQWRAKLPRAQACQAGPGSPCCCLPAGAPLAGRGRPA